MPGKRRNDDVASLGADLHVYERPSEATKEQDREQPNYPPFFHPDHTRFHPITARRLVATGVGSPNDCHEEPVDDAGEHRDNAGDQHHRHKQQQQANHEQANGEAVRSEEAVFHVRMLSDRMFAFHHKLPRQLSTQSRH